MDKILKVSLIEELRNTYNTYEYVFVVNISGLQANLNNAIRKNIADANGKAMVIKNTLNKISIKETPYVDISDSLIGQNMSIFSNNPVEISKILVNASKDETSGINIIGVSDGKEFYKQDYVQALSKMPSMDIIRASLLSVMQSVQRKIAYSVSYCPTALTRVISNNFKSK
ncbi:MAG: large subunit ribosomal protein L10 [Candidatus Deianiraeaceae bacterium]|jgi:large subunit ribosomal protein L10